MLEKITSYIKKDTLEFAFTVIAVCIFIIFISIFSFCILQSDDYYYSAFFKNGFLDFIRLTKEHFLSVNGRALVHFVLQVVLSLPSPFMHLINTAVIFSIGCLSFYLYHYNKIGLNTYLVLFFALFMLMGSDIFKETVMWTSGFYNYIFPALFVFLALCLCKDEKNALCCVFSFFSGATTEQWGAAVCVMLFVYIFLSHKKDIKKYTPVIFSLAGYCTIFLSPATLSRISVSGHTRLYSALFDISRLSGAFFNVKASLLPILFFIATSIIYAYLKKGIYSAFYFGFLPLCLILLLPFHKSYITVLVIFICYITLTASIFFYKKHTLTSTLLSGALSAIIIMLPTNTFDPRISFPATLLVLLASISIISDITVSKNAFCSFSAVLLAVGLIFFYPSYIGFYKNHLIDSQNMSAVKIAQKTDILTYSVDYDKNFAMRQMFNDGWFFNKFLKLYDIENCKVYLDSYNAKDIYFNAKKLKSRALTKDNAAYIPMRNFIEETGGNITDDSSLTFELNGKSLVYFDGILTYTNSSGAEKYLIADESCLPDIYTLYIRSDYVEDAFHIKLNIDNN